MGQCLQILPCTVKSASLNFEGTEIERIFPVSRSSAAFGDSAEAIKAHPVFMGFFHKISLAFRRYREKQLIFAAFAQEKHDLRQGSGLSKQGASPMIRKRVYGVPAAVEVRNDGNGFPYTVAGVNTGGGVTPYQQCLFPRRGNRIPEKCETLNSPKGMTPSAACTLPAPIRPLR